MIDICQLVPFAQVVLLTAIKYLREDEKEVTGVGEQREDLLVAKGGRPDEGGVDVDEEPKSQKAWLPNNTESVATDNMKKLLTNR